MVSRKRIWLLLFILFHFYGAMGQTILIHHSNKDTAYIREYYNHHLVVRAYESTKFTNFKFIDGPNKLIYKPNVHNNFGLGFNYKFLSLNFSVYDPSIGKNINTYGRTRQIDLQTHLYVHKFIIDLYGQFYRGYYLSNTGGSVNNYSDKVEKRPDINSKDISLVFQYVFNDKRFSYNAAFYQNERQKKSAGSFLLGGGIYHTSVNADSSLTPANISFNNFFQNYHFNATGNTALGFNGGYAYTVVIKKVFFITAIVSGGAGINSAFMSNNGGNERNQTFGAAFNLTERFAAGYNSDNYFAGVTYIRLITENNMAERDTWQEFNTGNFRFTFAKRFRLKKSLIPKSGLIQVE